MLHVPGLGFEGLVGYSPIAMAKNAISLAIATEEYGAKFFANGATPGDILEYPGTVKNPEAVRESWAIDFSGNNSHKVAVIFKRSFLVIFKLPLSSIRISMHLERLSETAMKVPLTSICSLLRCLKTSSTSWQSMQIPLSRTVQRNDLMSSAPSPSTRCFRKSSNSGA